MLHSRWRMPTQQHSRRRWGREWKREENGSFRQYLLPTLVTKFFTEHLSGSRSEEEMRRMNSLTKIFTLLYLKF